VVYRVRFDELSADILLPAPLHLHHLLGHHAHIVHLLIFFEFSAPSLVIGFLLINLFLDVLEVLSVDLSIGVLVPGRKVRVLILDLCHLVLALFLLRLLILSAGQELS